MQASLTSVGALLAAGVIGGAIAVGVDQSVGEGGTTTVIREVGVGTAESSAFRETTGRTISDIYATSRRGVVQVVVTSVVSENPFFGAQERQGLGSGFVIDKSGHVVTNYHVVENASRVEVSFSGNDEMPATVVGTDPSTDIAVLRIKGAQNRSLTPLELVDEAVGGLHPARGTKRTTAGREARQAEMGSDAVGVSTEDQPLRLESR